MKNKLRITSDYREKPSGIPDILINKGVVTELGEIKSGDYFPIQKLTNNFNGFIIS